ncbi:MAG: LytTR family DNA-binding domain-containing protein [Bacteroidota bacterium]
MKNEIKAVIIDDEQKGRDFLKNMLHEFCPQINIVATADGIEEGLEIIQLNEPELIFLDIKMPRGTGFDLLEKLGKTNFEVIFTTAHDDFALRAIKFSALDYLLKPIDPDELRAAVKKVEGKVQEPKSRPSFDNFLVNLQRKNVFSQIGLPTNDGIIFVRVEEIVRCQAEGSYTNVFLESKKSFLVSRNLREIESLLEESGFLRVHKSHLINLNHIHKYVRGNGGEVTMSDGAVVEISRRRKDILLEKLHGSV